MLWTTINKGKEEKEKKQIARGGKQAEDVEDSERELTQNRFEKKNWDK